MTSKGRVCERQMLLITREIHVEDEYEHLKRHDADEVKEEVGAYEVCCGTEWVADEAVCVERRV